jgi:CheY-like chemotaxis protein
MTGDPLSTLLHSGPLSAAEAVRIVEDSAAALVEVHGELSPSSILVRDDGVEVLPPGGADRAIYGPYASPERILGRAATAESDVFSLAAILFHALAGHPPFRGATPSEVMLAACSEPPLALPPQVPHALEKIITRALSKPPLQRYPTPASLCDALQTYASHRTWEGRRLLAVDDDQPMRVLYQRLITRVGMEGEVAASGREAIEALKARRYDVVLLDLNLPRLNGWEVLDFLRARPDVRPRFLFIITGFVDQRVSEADRDLVTAVLYKPVAQDELQMLVTECLRGPAPDLAAILRKTSHRAGTAA